MQERRYGAPRPSASANHQGTRASSAPSSSTFSCSSTSTPSDSRYSQRRASRPGGARGVARAVAAAAAGAVGTVGAWLERTVPSKRAATEIGVAALSIGCLVLVENRLRQQHIAKLSRTWKVRFAVPSSTQARASRARSTHQGVPRQVVSKEKRKPKPVETGQRGWPFGERPKTSAPGNRKEAAAVAVKPAALLPIRWATPARLSNLINLEPGAELPTRDKGGRRGAMQSAL
jgi:hypothetical protein